MQANKTMDMTKGNILRHILIFAIPLLIGNLFQQLYNIVDMVIAGYLLDDDALAAVGATSTLSSLIIGFSIGVNNGFGIIWSRKFGAKEDEELRHAIGVSVVLNVILIFCMTSVSIMGLKPLLHLMNVPDSIFHRCYQYIFLILAGLGVTLLYNMEAGILRAVGNSRVPLYFIMATSILNVGFNLFLVQVVHMDVSGLAWGTIFSQICCVIGCFFYIRLNYPELRLKRKHFHLEKELVAELSTTGLSMGLMMSIFSIGSVILQSAVNGLGKTIVTAHTAARRILELFMQPSATLSVSTATFVSQNYGAGQSKRIVKGVKLSCIVFLIWSVGAFFAVRIFGGNMVAVLTHTKNPDVMANAVMNLNINMNFFFFLGILSILRSAMQGFGYKAAPLIASGIELGMKSLSKFLIVPRFHYKGASYTEPSTWLVCMAFLLAVIWFQRKDIKNRLNINNIEEVNRI